MIGSRATVTGTIVEAGAKTFSNIDHMVVLNGADGMSEMFAQIGDLTTRD
ncbi:MAG: hypothetical protein QOI21_4349 [Actinomycetota bacterium]|nr:hypothetical protein [Actinomycetota bacterium]